MYQDNVNIWRSDYWEAFRPNRFVDVASPEPPYGYRFGLAGVCLLVVMLAVRLWG